MRIFVLALLFSSLPAQAASQLDRLFFTEAERRALDGARERAGKTDVGDYAAPSINGMVRRSDGKNTIWVNGRPFRASDAVAGRAAALPIESAENLRITVTSGDQTMPRSRDTSRRPSRP